MEIWNSILEAQVDLKQRQLTSAVTIGNFDGVHRGHQTIIRRTLELAREDQGLSIVFSFSNHSEGIIGEQPFLINNPRRRRELFEQQGLDVLFEVPFDKKFAQVSAEEFFRTWLLEGLNLKSLVVGYDFKFGAGGRGNYQSLQGLAREAGCRLEQVAPVYEDGSIISSSKIRQLLAEGQIELANRMLGYNFTIEGEVSSGEKIGRKLGFPTVNIRLEPSYLLPCYGVYWVKLFTNSKAFYGLANVGIKPTFGKHEPLVEVYLIDVAVDLYRQPVQVEFLRFIRPENRFSGPEALKHQIEQDLKVARSYLNEM